MRIVKIFVDFCGVHHELGGYDINRVSLVVCVNDLMRDMFQRGKYDDENFVCKGTLPWSEEKLLIELDMQFMEFLKLHLAKGAQDVNLKIDLLPLQTLPFDPNVVPTNSSPAQKGLASLENPSDPGDSPNNDVPISQLTQANITQQPEH